MQNITSLFNRIRRPQSAAPQNPVMAKQFQALDQRLRGAVRFLQKTSIRKNGKSLNLSRLPWYLLLGASGSGKTTLLANSNINYILDKKNARDAVDENTPSDTCDWRVTRDLVIIDVPGGYQGGKGRNVFTSVKLWDHFLDLIKKLRGENGVNGAVIALSLPELLDRQNRDQMLDNLNLKISDLRSKFGSDLPFYFTITKCDLLPGFLDFFNDSGTDELAQAWGFALHDLAETESLADVCASRFDNLISRLNKQLLWRLHQERNQYARIYIKDFPLQVESLKETVTDFLRALSRLTGSFSLKGMYLTSAMQYQDPEVSHPQTVSADEFQRSMEIMSAPVLRRQSYFIKQFLLQSIVHAAPAPVKSTWQKPAMVAAVVLCMMVVLGSGLQGTGIFKGLRNSPSRHIDLAQNHVKTKPEAGLPPASQLAATVSKPALASRLASQTGDKISKSTREDKV